MSAYFVNTFGYAIKISY